MFYLYFFILLVYCGKTRGIYRASTTSLLASVVTTTLVAFVVSPLILIAIIVPRITIVRIIQNGTHKIHQDHPIFVVKAVNTARTLAVES